MARARAEFVESLGKQRRGPGDEEPDRAANALVEIRMGEEARVVRRYAHHHARLVEEPDDFKAASNLGSQIMRHPARSAQ